MCDPYVLCSEISALLGSRHMRLAGSSWSTSTLPVTGLVLCFHSDPQAMELVVTREGKFTNHYALHCLSSLQLKLLSGFMSAFFLSIITSHGHLLSRHCAKSHSCWELRSLGHNCSMLPSSQIRSASNPACQQALCSTQSPGV